MYAYEITTRYRQVDLGSNVVVAESLEAASDYAAKIWNGDTRIVGIRQIGHAWVAKKSKKT